MTRREIWIAIGTLAVGLALVTGFVLLAGGAPREVQMSSEQQFSLAVLQKKIDSIPVILTAVGALITILVGAVIMIWNQMRKVSANTEAVAASTEAVRLSTLELKKINEQVVASQAELTKNQDEMKKSVDGLLTKKVEDAASLGHLRGEAEARKEADSAAEIESVKAAAALLVERVKTDAAVAAVAAVAVGRERSQTVAPVSDVTATGEKKAASEEKAAASEEKKSASVEKLAASVEKAAALLAGGQSPEKPKPPGGTA